MLISGAAERLSARLRRLVYVNAFVPLPGECLHDMVPPHYVALFEQVAAANGNAVMLPFAIWREAFDYMLAHGTVLPLTTYPAVVAHTKDIEVGTGAMNPGGIDLNRIVWK